MNKENIKESELAVVVQGFELEKTKTELVINSFQSFLDQAKEFKSEAMSIVVTDENDKESMARARELRLSAKAVRTEAENTRKQLKEQSLREGKAIDGVANIIKAIVVPIEEHLEKQEKFAENLATKRKAEKFEQRVNSLSGFVNDISLYNLNDMSDEAFDNLLSGAKQAYEARIEAEKKSEEDRIKKIEEEKAEQERIKVENEKLKAEAEARQKEEEKRKLEEEQKEKERQTILESERKAKELAENKLKEKEEAEKKAKQDEERRLEQERLAKLEQERQEALAPEKDKLFKWAEQIKAIQSPKDLSVAGSKIVKEAESKLLAVSQFIKDEVKKI